MAAEERSPILPSREEAELLVPAPGGVTWKATGDVRVLNGAAYALLLQVMHPVIGAGVTEHSNFRQDPWGRLLRTLDYTSVMVFGGPELARQVGRRVREMHKHIKGELPGGGRYHALEPGPYAWVHATLADAVVTAHRHFGLSLSGAEVDEFWADWLRLGRLVGVRERDLPADWAAFREYFDDMVERELHDTPAARDVIELLTAPSAPPIGWLPGSAWRVARVPAARMSALALTGMLPPVLRDRLGLRWTRSDQRRLRMVGAASRRARPLMPPALRCFGPRYLRLRREAIARGDVASPSRPHSSSSDQGVPPGDPAPAG